VKHAFYIMPPISLVGILTFSLALVVSGNTHAVVDVIGCK
jgi:hypothetical protein